MPTRAKAKRLHLRLLIEGEEVPVIAGIVTQAVNATATAYIQVIATSKVLDLRPRSIVQLFYRQNGEPRKLQDLEAIPFYSYDLKSQTIVREIRPASGQTAGPLLNRLFDDQKVTAQQIETELQYDLLFYGELAGYSFYEDSRNRTINLMCVDMSNNFDTLNQYTFDVNQVLQMGAAARLTLLSGFTDKGLTDAVQQDNGSESDPLIQATSGKTPDIKLFDYADLVGGSPLSPGEHSAMFTASSVLGVEQLLAQKLGTLGLVQGIKAIFDLIKKAYVYYQDIDEELNLRDQLFVIDDKVTSKIFNSAQLQAYIHQGIIQKYGTINSFKNLLKLVFKIGHFEFLPMATAPFQPGDPVVGSSVALKTTVLKPELYFAEPPACNIVWPDELYILNVSRHFLVEPTRGIASTDHVVDPDLREGDGLTAWYTVAPMAMIQGIDSRGRPKEISYTPESMIKLVNGLNSSLVNFGKILLPDEIIKGIIPFNSFVSHSLRAAALATSSQQGSTPERVEGAAPLIPLFDTTPDYSNYEASYKRFFIQESNYNFLVAKYQNRTASASLGFAPRLVPGFTGLIVEKAPFISLRQGDDFFGYLGYIQQLTHTISQAGGVTSVQYSHVRPTNDYLDVFNLKGGAFEPKSIVPDYRDAGVMPWAQGEYGFDVLFKKYAGWLGGMDWKGVQIKQGNADYLGIMPLTLAISSFSLTSITGLGTTQQLKEAFIPLIRELMKLYLQGVVKARVPFDEVMAPLLRRPVANMAQMRGYLHAYHSEVKHSTVDELSESVNMIESRQTVLARMGFLRVGEYELGVWGAGSIAALKKLQVVLKSQDEKSNLMTSGAWDRDTQKAVEDLLQYGGTALAKLPTAIGQDDRAELFRLALDIEMKAILRNRRVRRLVRLGAVLEYKKSLEGPGGLRG